VSSSTRPTAQSCAAALEASTAPAASPTADTSVTAGAAPGTVSDTGPAAAAPAAAGGADTVGAGGASTGTGSVAAAAAGGSPDPSPDGAACTSRSAGLRSFVGTGARGRLRDGTGDTRRSAGAAAAGVTGGGTTSVMALSTAGAAVPERTTGAEGVMVAGGSGGRLPSTLAEAVGGVRTALGMRASRCGGRSGAWSK
jgi:hypothetical protein